MKRTFRFLLFAAIITAIVLSINIFSASAANEKVVYISADGTGDGSSPDKPLGNAKGYKPGNKMETYNAFYLGLNELKSTGGKLVIVGDVSLDSVEARFSSGQNEVVAPSEFRTPKFSSGVSVTVTSVHDGVDYRAKGAELILDYETCNTTAFAFGCDARLIDLDILFKYNSDRPNSWNTPFMLGGGGYDFVIDEGVKVTSLDTKTNSEGTEYPLILGGHRYASLERNYSLVVKSGTWSNVIAGSFGITGHSQYGKVDGTVNVDISGGKIKNFVGTGSLTHPSNTITGNLTITVSGGEIENFYAVHPSDFTGNKISITLRKDAKIGKFYYAPDDYQGNLSVLVGKVNITNQNAVEIIKPVTPVATQPPATQPPATQITEPEVTETAAEITAPETINETSPETQKEKEPALDKGLVSDLKMILLVFIIVAAVIGISAFALNAIKMKFLK